LFEMLAYSGYKFVGLCLIIVAQMLLGFMVSYIVLIFTGFMFFVFYFHTMKRFASANTLAEHIKEVSLNKKTFLIANAAVQFLIIWMLSWN
jgi:hypothetical protein